ncbi:MAG: hypoxanthine phosphoribosyltransferase [Deltaproteobacteria bacterium]
MLNDGRHQALDTGNNSEITRILFGEDEIRARVRELGRRITEDYRGTTPVLVGTLKGSFVFLADLIREISIPITLDFISVSSYCGSSQTGAVKIQKDLDESVSERRVVIVEDILDTGITANYLMKWLRARNPADVRICVLLDKQARRRVDIAPDYVGFEILDEFVVGYGMDYNQQYRNLPHIGILRP